MTNDNFFSIVALMKSTKFRCCADKVVLFYSDAMVTFQRWEGDATRMQISVDTPSNTITCMLGSLFMVTYLTSDETLNIAGVDINGNEYRYTQYVGTTLSQEDVSLDELLEDDTSN
jgi:hypothetical protein